MNQTNDPGNPPVAAQRKFSRRSGLIALTLASAAIVTIAALYFRPHGHLAVTILELRPGRDEETLKRFLTSTDAAYTPAYVATQFEVLRSSEILEPVIQKLDLTRKLARDGRPLSKEEALDALRSQLELHEIKNTDLIKIGVRNKDAQLAANIANAITDSYRENRQTFTRASIDKNLQQFKDQVEAQHKRVAEEHQAAIHLLADLQIVDNDPSNPSAPITLGETAAQNLQDAKRRTHDYVDAKTRYLEDKRILESMSMQYNAELLKEKANSLQVKVWETAAPPQER